MDTLLLLSRFTYYKLSNGRVSGMSEAGKFRTLHSAITILSDISFCEYIPLQAVLDLDGTVLKALAIFLMTLGYI